MHCPNCGNELAENAAFCANCGTPAPAPQPAEVQAVKTPVEPKPSLITVLTSLLKTNKTVMYGAIGGAVLLVLIIVLLCCGGKGYKKPVEKYLDFIADKNTDSGDFFTDAYFGGDFGDFLFIGDAEDANNTIINVSYEEELGDDSDYDNWEDYAEEEMLPELFDRFEDTYGEWELDYDIVECEELSRRNLSDLRDEFEDIIEEYEELLDDIDFNADEEETIEDFIDDICDERIDKAYSVKVEVSIESEEEGLCDEEYEFIVAKVAGDWTILDGPSIISFLYMDN